MYNEVDPTLGKVLRNIKLAIDTLQNFVELQQFGEPCIAPAACDMLEWQPPIDRLELQKMLRSTASGKEHVPVLLAKLSKCLRDQEEYCRIVPLISVALLFRSIYVEPVEHGSDFRDFTSKLEKEDLLRLIKETCESVKVEMMPRYANSLGMPEGLYDQYFLTIEASLVRKVEDKDVADFSYYASLRERVPNLPPEEYRRSHRSRLKYFGKGESSYAGGFGLPLSAAESYYLQVPRDEIAIARNVEVQFIQPRVVSLQGGRGFRVVLAGTSGAGIPNFEYLFSGDLEVIEVKSADNTKQVFDELARQGKVRGDFYSEYLKRLRSNVLYWTGKVWTSEPTSILH